MKTCVRNHEWTPENTRTRKDGYRSCRACNAERQRRMRVEGKIAPLTPQQKARKSANEKGRKRTDRVLTPEQRVRKNTRARAVTEERAWARVFGRYTWEDKKAS